MNARAARRFVAYYRVSTDRQGRSGLGLEAQQKAVRDYLDGGAWEIVAEFAEVESGKRADRPDLARALEACRKHKARLVIAKLDRLSRNLAFIATLMDSGVEFVAVDNPHANKLTIHILAAVAEHERKSNFRMHQGGPGRSQRAGRNWAHRTRPAPLPAWARRSGRRRRGLPPTCCRSSVRCRPPGIKAPTQSPSSSMRERLRPLGAVGGLMCKSDRSSIAMPWASDWGGR